MQDRQAILGAVIQVTEETQQTWSKLASRISLRHAAFIRSGGSKRCKWGRILLDWGGRRDASVERVRRGAQYLTPASTLLLLGKSPLQALDLRVQLSLKPTQLRDQTGLSPNNIGIGMVKLKH